MNREALFVIVGLGAFALGLFLGAAGVMTGISGVTSRVRTVSPKEIELVSQTKAPR